MSNPSIRILALVTDAFGGHGGIAQANRDLLTAMALDPRVDEIVVIPRVIADEIGTIPAKIAIERRAATGTAAFFAAIASSIVQNRAFDLILCGHIHLLPAAWLARAFTGGAPIAMVIHGIDAWQPTGRIAVDSLVGRIDALLSVSELTRERFIAWSGYAGPSFVLPNCVHLDEWKAEPRAADLAEQYGLQGRKVIMTLGRIDSRERTKGFDEIVSLLPALSRDVPEIVYVVAGDGDDRERLERDVEAIEVADRVVFTGWVPEQRKADVLRLADVFILPSRGEGFGIVLLEALACGVPVIASRLDGTREALLDGRLGRLVDPRDPGELHREILDSLADPRPIDRELLATFDFAEFAKRASAVLGEII